MHLRPLRAEEVASYLTFRLERAGRTAKLFLPDAIEAVHRASRGIPRLIDRIAEHSLLAALKARRNVIDLSSASARNFFALEDQAATCGAEIEDGTLRATVLARETWGEVVFERV